MKVPIIKKISKMGNDLIVVIPRDRAEEFSRGKKVVMSLAEWEYETEEG